MSFLSRRKAELAEKGVDSARVPPGQYVTDRFPVLHAGVTPKVQLTKWDFRVEGLVGEPVAWSYQDMLDMPQTESTFDIHCVTKWSKLDTIWRGVAVTEVMSRLTPSPGSSHVLVLAEQGFSANIPFADFSWPENLI
ncbi:MAG: molybdopterin-dependent oxidoreductase, partial [Acidimicrobiia bacterium]